MQCAQLAAYIQQLTHSTDAAELTILLFMYRHHSRSLCVFATHFTVIQP